MKMKEREVNKHLADLACLGNLTFPSKLSFAISYNIEKLQRESERIEKERKKLCERYADKDDDDNPVMEESIVNGKKMLEYKISEENMKLLTEECEELLDAEADIEIRTVKKDLIERCEQADRYDIPSVSQLHGMAFMLEE